MSAGWHAFRQFVWHLESHTYSAPEWLTREETELFARMPPADQFEGLKVVETLRDWGYGADRELLAAGLLHDVGKSLAPPWVGYRVAMTALDMLVPGLVPRLARRHGPLGVLARHAAIGAELARQAGLPNSLVALIRDHHSPPADERMAALQRADGLH